MLATLELRVDESVRIERSFASEVRRRQTAQVFETKTLPVDVDRVAPDGADVRALLQLAGGAVAYFELPARETSMAVRHRTVKEIWFFVSGRGQMWRRHGDREETVDVAPGVRVTIPLGTEFQFRSQGAEPLAAIAVTMPPWPGDGEAIRSVGPWEPTLPPGPGLAED